MCGIDACGDEFGGLLARKWADGSEAEVLAIAVRFKDCPAGFACVSVGLCGGLAAGAQAEDVRDTGCAACENPELACGGSAEDGVGADLSCAGEFLNGFERAARSEWACGIADEPWAHAVLRGLAGEGVEVSAAGIAA